MASEIPPTEVITCEVDLPPQEQPPPPPTTVIQMPENIEEPSANQAFFLRAITLGEQIDVLTRERDTALKYISVLRKLQSEPYVSVDDLNVNLMPAINNQRKANQSLGRALRKVVKFQNNSMMDTLVNASGQSAAPTMVPVHVDSFDPNASVDEVDMAGGNNDVSGGNVGNRDEEQHYESASEESS